MCTPVESSLSEQIDQMIGEMEWGDVVDTLYAAVGDMVSDTNDPALLNPPPPAVPAAGGFNTCLQPVEHLPEGSLGTSLTKKRKRREQEADGQAYIAKPPNAFMLFRQEQRPNIVSETNFRDSAAVNKLLGQKWNMLSPEEKAKYFEQAAVERVLHAVRHPGWSASQNYGKKPKRQRRKAPTTAEAVSATFSRGHEIFTN